MSHALLREITHHIQTTRMPETRFGREACGDPNLVSDLRRGRYAGPKLSQRVSRFIKRNSSDIRLSV